MFGHIIQELHHEAKSIIRQVERTSKKIVNAETAVKFNQICLKEELLPKYTHIYIYIYIYIYII